MLNTPIHSFIFKKSRLYLIHIVFAEIMKTDLHFIKMYIKSPLPAMCVLHYFAEMRFVRGHNSYTHFYFVWSPWFDNFSHTLKQTLILKNKTRNRSIKHTRFPTIMQRIRYLNAVTQPNIFNSKLCSCSSVQLRDEQSLNHLDLQLND